MSACIHSPAPAHVSPNHPTCCRVHMPRALNANPPTLNSIFVSWISKYGGRARKRGETEETGEERAAGTWVEETYPVLLSGVERLHPLPRTRARLPEPPHLPPRKTLDQDQRPSGGELTHDAGSMQSRKRRERHATPPAHVSPNHPTCFPTPPVNVLLLVNAERRIDAAEAPRREHEAHNRRRVAHQQPADTWQSEMGDDGGERRGGGTQSEQETKGRSTGRCLALGARYTLCLANVTTLPF